jgi:trigger factor
VDLKIDKQDLAERRVQLTVEVPPDRLESALHSAARRIGTRTRIPGFRPGKAPYKMIVQKVGEDAVFDEALDELGQEVYRQALGEAEVEPYAPGSLDEVVSREPLTLRYTIPLEPEVELGDYRAIRIPAEAPQVADEAVDHMVEELRQRHAVMETVQRQAEMTDVVVLDVIGQLASEVEGSTGKLLEEKGVPVLVADATDWPIPGIAPQLVGMAAEAEKDVEYVFPEDYINESLRGKAARFHLRCVEVKSRALPELNDELARQLGEFTDLMDLKLKVRKSLLEEATRTGERDYANQAVEALVAGATYQYPPVMLEEEQKAMLRELDRRLQAQRLSLADYLKIEKKTEDDLKKELEPQAVERVKRSLGLGKLVELEDLHIEDSEVTAELERVVAPWDSQSKDVRKAIDNPVGRRSIAMDLLTDKAVHRLVAIARGEADSPTAPAAQDLHAESTTAGAEPQE